MQHVELSQRRAVEQLASYLLFQRRPSTREAQQTQQEARSGCLAPPAGRGHHCDQLVCVGLFFCRELYFTLETLPVPVKQNVTGPIDLGISPMEISYPQSLTAWMAWLTFL